MAQDGGAEALAQRHVPGSRLSGHHLLQRAEAEGYEEESGRGRSRTAAHVREAGHSAVGTEAVGRSRCRCGLRFRLGRDDLQGEAQKTRRHLLLVHRGDTRSRRSRPKVSGLGRAGRRQLLRCTEQRGLLRRLVRLHPARRPLPDGAIDLLPHQQLRVGPVRANAHRRGGRRIRLVSRRVHRAALRQESTSRGGRRTRRARRRRDQILDRPELVRGRRDWQGRHIQLGSTLRASFRATTPSASSTRSRSRIIPSRPTRARR